MEHCEGKGKEGKEGRVNVERNEVRFRFREAFRGERGEIESEKRAQLTFPDPAWL